MATALDRELAACRFEDDRLGHRFRRLVGFVELSYSPTGIFGPTPELIGLRFSLSPRQKLPPPDELNKPYGNLTRSAV